MNLHRYTYIESAARLAKSMPNFPDQIGLNQVKKPDDLWRILAKVRSRVGKVIGPESFDAAHLRILDAYRAQNYTAAQQLIEGYNNQAPDLTTQVVTDIAHFAPLYRQIILGKTNPALYGCTIYRVQSGQLFVRPENQPYEGVSYEKVLAENQNITSEKLQQIAALYQAFLHAGRYNSLHSLLRFTEHMHMVQKVNPDLLPHEVVPAYTADIPQNQAQSKGSGRFGGSCIDHAHYFVQQLQNIGIKGYVLGESGYNVLARTYDGARTQDWNESLNMLQYSHTSAVVHCTLAPGELLNGKPVDALNSRIMLRFEMGAGTKFAMEIFVPKPGGQWVELNGNTVLTAKQAMALLTQADTAELHRRSLRAHLISSVHKNPEPEFDESSETLRVNFAEGVIRITSRHLPSLKEFYFEDGLEDGIEISEDRAEFKTLTSSFTHRSALSRRKRDKLYQIKFDLRAYAANKDKEVLIVTERNKRMRTTARNAFIIFCKDIQNHFDFGDDFVQDMLYIFDHYTEVQLLFYPYVQT